MACAEWASPSMFSSILFTSFRIAVDIAFMTLSVILYIHINKLFYRIIYYFLYIYTKAWLCCLYICAATAVSKYRVMHSFIYIPDMPKLFFFAFLNTQIFGLSNSGRPDHTCLRHIRFPHFHYYYYLQRPVVSILYPISTRTACVLQMPDPWTCSTFTSSRCYDT